MTDDDREKIAQAFREHALRIETTAFQEASRLKQDIVAELVEIAARFCDVADMLEDDARSNTVLRSEPSKDPDGPPSKSNGADR